MVKVHYVRPVQFGTHRLPQVPQRAKLYSHDEAVWYLVVVRLPCSCSLLYAVHNTDGLLSNYYVLSFFFAYTDHRDPVTLTCYALVANPESLSTTYLPNFFLSRTHRIATHNFLRRDIVLLRGGEKL